MTTPGAESYDADGYAVKTATATLPIKAHIQPMGTKDLRNVPEGQNTLQWIVIWSETSLPEKNTIDYNGVIFEIQKVEFWDDGPFYKAAGVHTAT